MITADLYFKRFNWIRIIYIYILLTNQIERRKELAKELQYVLQKGYKKNFKIMVLRDFNENMDQFIDKQANRQLTNFYIFCFLNLMNHYRLFNTIKHYSTAPFPYTWKSGDRQSWINGIYISDLLIDESIVSMIEDLLRPNISDHAYVLTKFNQGFFFKQNRFFDHKNKLQTCHFYFQKMDSEK